MLRIKKEGEILRPTHLPFENKSVFNPGIFQDGKTVHVVYRALNDKFISSFGYARLDGPVRVAERWQEPFMSPRHKHEKKCIEDPRIVRIGKTIYMVYVAHDGKNALLAYAHGRDLFKLRRAGIISPQISYRRAEKLFLFSKLKDAYYTFASYYEKGAGKNVYIWEKDGALFPEKIGGKFALLHRILPDIQLARFNDFSELKNQDYWHDHLQHLSQHVVLEGEHGFETRHIGGGAPPIKTQKGWLLIYHACQHFNKGRIYTAAAALLDLKNPRKVIARLPYPLIVPKERNERYGHVHDVVFPTGTSQFRGRLYIYYGSADSYIAVASVKTDDLIHELLRHKTPKIN